MTKCYMCGSEIEVPKQTDSGKYICKKCYFKQMLKKKLKLWS
jgi:DNA-directed RNA polymerase subunit M/transcription elongation factor TFIIS